MTDRVLPVETTHNVATFDIVIDGEVMDPGYQVLSITIRKEVNRIPAARLLIRDGNPSEETFKISEQESYLPGTPVRINMGRDGENVQAFKGIIVRHSIRARENGETELILECRDESVKMTLGRRNRYFENVKDSELIEQIIGKYPGLSHDVQSTTLTHPEMVQHHCTDWDFLMMRAEANGKVVLVDDGKIKITSPETDSDPVLSVLFGSTLLDFQAEMDARNQWSSVEAKSWDYSAQTMFQFDTDEVPVTEPGNVTGRELSESIAPDVYELRHTGQAVGEELQEWARSVLQKSRLSKILGRAKFIGFGEIKPGQMIGIQGVGARFNGNAYVSGVRHDVYQGAWYSHAQFGLNPGLFARDHQDIVDVPAAGLIGSVHGLQIGKVVQLQNDPHGENRILVRLPIIDNSARGIWARIARLDAGENRGSIFLPEIEDEVIVGFLNDDPRDAVILGMLNSSAKPSPIEAQDDNHEKGFVTRSGMRIHFDDASRTITIDTPDGNSIKLDEAGAAITIQDQNQNSVTLNASGIELDGKGDIIIKATGKVDINAGSMLSLSGAQLTASAQAAMEVKGATAKLSADGMTEIKGSLVKIN